MAKITKITNEAEHFAALDRLDEILLAHPSSPKGKECIELLEVIEAYEEIHYPIEDILPLTKGIENG